jgi:fructose-specific component phosphotransferase system IIB-like protein
MTSTEEGRSFPDTLEGFGYTFNTEGQLRKIDPNTGKPGNEPFEFHVSENQDYNQKRYEALGDVITEYVYGLLETEVGLQRMMVPHQGAVQKSAVIFVSSDALSKPDVLLVLIPGSGVVKSGQWARSLIINDSLQSGSQIPFIKRARELGYAVIVMNPNENTKVINGKKINIVNSSNATEHADYVWKHYVKEGTPKHIAVIAHSYGGFLTVDLATRYFSHFHSNVFAIALTDSVHNLKMQNVPSRVAGYLQKVSRNWASHNSPLDTPLPNVMDGNIPRVSAGHTKHEMTSWSSFESVFTFIEEQYAASTKKEEL